MGITIDQVHIDRVLTVLQQQGMPYPLEGVVGLCPELTWDQVFLAIDYLSRTGQIRLTLDADRAYRIEAALPVRNPCSPVLSATQGTSTTNDAGNVPKAWPEVRDGSITFSVGK